MSISPMVHTIVAINEKESRVQTSPWEKDMEMLHPGEISGQIVPFIGNGASGC